MTQDQGPRPGGRWGRFRRELRTSARNEIRDLPRNILGELAVAAAVVCWFVLCIAAGGYVGWLVAGGPGMVWGAVIGFIVAALGVAVFYVVVFVAAGASGLRAGRRHRRAQRAGRGT